MFILKLINNSFKGIISVYLSEPPCKDYIVQFTAAPWNLYLINIMEDIVGCCRFKHVWLIPLWFLPCRNAQFFFLRETTIEQDQFLKLKKWI